MGRICKLCKKFVCNKYGFCPPCWKKKPESEKDRIEYDYNVRAGNIYPDKKLGDFL